MDGAKRGFSLIDWLVLLVVVGGLMVFLWPVVFRPFGRNQKATSCASNLCQLWKMENIYMIQFGGRPKAMPSETGRAFWLKLREVKLLEDEAADLYRCPVLRKNTPECQYRGPGASIATLKDDAIVGADDLQNHGGDGGNVLRKSGDVTEYEQAEFETVTWYMK